MSNVVDIKQARQWKQAQVQKEQLDEKDWNYQARIMSMDKLALLEEMVRFQEQKSAVGELSPEMMKQGRILFKALEDSAETEELRILARSYRRHLDLELAELRKKLSSAPQS